MGRLGGFLGGLWGLLGAAGRGDGQRGGGAEATGQREPWAARRRLRRRKQSDWKKPYPTPPGTRAVREGPHEKRSWAFAAGSGSNVLQSLPRGRCPKRYGVWFFPIRWRFHEVAILSAPWEVFLEVPAEASGAASESPLGASLGRCRSLWKASWGPAGCGDGQMVGRRSRVPAGASVAAVLGASWAVWEASGGLWGACWAFLGAAWEAA